jgi:ribonuclease HI
MSDEFYADGAAENNPIGPCAAGAVHFRNGKIVKVAGRRLGIASNNVAEYGGLRLALQLAREAGVRKPTIYMDSKLVVEQFRTNGWNCNVPTLIALRAHAREEARWFDSVKLVWIPRERNAAADLASKESLDGILDDHPLPAYDLANEITPTIVPAKRETIKDVRQREAAARAVLDDIADLHQPFVVGVSNSSRCQQCNQTVPCKTARLIHKWKSGVKP